MEADKTDLEAQLRASLNGARQRQRLVDGAAQAPTTKGVRTTEGRWSKGNGCATDAELKKPAHPSATHAPIADDTSRLFVSCTAEPDDLAPEARGGSPAHRLHPEARPQRALQLQLRNRRRYRRHRSVTSCPSWAWW